jgi:hypothetical protein
MEEPIRICATELADRPWLETGLPSMECLLKYWARVQLQCSDEQMEHLGFDYFAEVWMAVVETAEGLRA